MKEKERKLPNKIKTYKRIQGVIGIIILGLGLYFYFAFFNKTEIDLSKNMEVSFGDQFTVNGNGSFSIRNNDIDYDANEPQIQSFLDTLSYDYSPKNNLKNGDEVTVRVNYSKEIAKKLKLKVVGGTRKFIVEGLVEFSEGSRDHQVQTDLEVVQAEPSELGIYQIVEIYDKSGDKVIQEGTKEWEDYRNGLLQLPHFELKENNICDFYSAYGKHKFKYELNGSTFTLIDNEDVRHEMTYENNIVSGDIDYNFEYAYKKLENCFIEYENSAFTGLDLAELMEFSRENMQDGMDPFTFVKDNLTEYFQTQFSQECTVDYVYQTGLTSTNDNFGVYKSWENTNGENSALRCVIYPEGKKYDNGNVLVMEFEIVPSLNDAFDSFVSMNIYFEDSIHSKDKVLHLKLKNSDVDTQILPTKDEVLKLTEDYLR